MRRSASAALAALCSLWMAGAAHGKATLPVWVRAAGSYGTGADPERQAQRVIDLSSLQQQQVQKLDVQYQAKMFYRGVPLRTVIAAYGPPAQVDLLLLRFKNGMVVPLPFRDERAMGRLDPLIALGVARSEKGQYTDGRFAPLDRHVEGYADVRQANFSDNKLVISDRWHPDVPDTSADAFTPWSMVDSLAGIEFVKSAAYYRQFDHGPDLQKGLLVYRQSCQFCHGVRKVGASFGWDYVQPIEIYTYKKDPRRLYYHVRYRATGNPRGELMPALKHVSEDDAAQLWPWLKAVATRPMPPYAP